MTYCIYAAKGITLTKVGFTGNIKTRLQTLKCSYGTKRILHTEPADSELLARAAECLCHKLLNDWHIEGEFFKVTKKVAVAAMRLAVRTVSYINDIFVYDKPRFIVKEALSYLARRIYGPPTFKMVEVAACYYGRATNISFAVGRRDHVMVHPKKTFARAISKMNREWKTQGYGATAQYYGRSMIRQREREEMEKQALRAGEEWKWGDNTVENQKKKGKK